MTVWVVTEKAFGWLRVMVFSSLEKAEKRADALRKRSDRVEVEVEVCEVDPEA